MAPTRTYDSQTSGAPISTFNMSELADALPSTSQMQRGCTTTRMRRRTPRSAPYAIQRRQPAAHRSEAEVGALSNMLDTVSLEPSAASSSAPSIVQRESSPDREAIRTATAWTPLATAIWRTLPDNSNSNPRGVMARTPSPLRQEQTAAYRRLLGRLTRVTTKGQGGRGLFNIANTPTPSIPRSVGRMSYDLSSMQTDDQAQSGYTSDDDSDMSEADEAFDPPERRPRRDSMDLE
jgi:hypothetical protein